MRNATLYVNYFASQQRRHEFDECLRRNLENVHIDRVVVMAQCAQPAEFVGRKVVWHLVDGSQFERGWPTFRAYFDAVNQHTTSPYEFAIVANADIYFDDSLGQIASLDLEGRCLALTRHEIREGRFVIESRANSQDAWVFQGRVKPLGDVNFAMGRWSCDNRLAWELRHADYVVHNPCRSIRAIHLHQDWRGDSSWPVPGPHEHVQHVSLEECRYGPQRQSRVGVIAMSLYGDAPKYCVGAIRNAILARSLYPGWTLRIYHDDTVPEGTLHELRSLKVELVRMPRNSGIGGMFWRFLAADDPGFEWWLVRDADSRLNYRERRCVDDWQASGRDFHLMRDHPQHNCEILGGSFGGRRGVVPGIKSLIEQWPENGKYGDDQNFLAHHVWPRVRATALIHTDFEWSEGLVKDSEVRPFPSGRENFRFVAERCYEDEHWDHEGRRLLAEHPRGNGNSEIGFGTVPKCRDSGGDFLIERPGKVLELQSLLSSRKNIYPLNPSLGVVIGTFAAVPYIHLQLEARRRHFPQVPALLHDDASPHSDLLAGLCQDYGADFESNVKRCPPCKGDLTAFVGGFVWAKERKLEVLLKLSRRFLPITDWTKSLLALAVESQYATFCTWTETFNFGFRTECVAVSVNEWFRLSLVEEIVRRVMQDGTPFVEAYVHNLARRAATFNCDAAMAYDQRIGQRPERRNGYAVWDWMGFDRAKRSPNFLWHDSSRPEEYYSLGQEWGLPYSFEEYLDPNAGFGSKPQPSR